MVHKSIDRNKNNTTAQHMPKANLLSLRINVNKWYMRKTTMNEAE